MKIIFLGSQGSGKSTQAQLLASYLNLPQIEMGQLLRSKSQETDDDAEKIREALNSGNLVPNEITIKTLKNELEKPKYNNGFVLDGYPRNRIQQEELPGGINKVFYVKVGDGESIKRLTKRGREDDSKEVIVKRLEIYHQKTEPLLEEFRKRGLLTEVNGERSIEDIHQEIISLIKK